MIAISGCIAKVEIEFLYFTGHIRCHQDMYAVTAGASGNTALYVSLDSDDAAASAGTAVPLLDQMGGGGFTVTG
jgi:hypothetical protein